MEEKKKVIPYFARFLEGSVKEEELDKVKGGQLTHKYPTDREETNLIIIP